MGFLSHRLETIAECVREGAKVCDIGTDHGYLAVFLKQTGKAKSVIATDLNPLPLKRAEKNIALSGVKGIELRLCDGLSGIKPYECDTVIIAGMGGEVISHILKNGDHITTVGGVRLILQPTTSPEALRQFLCENGYEIKRELPVCENRKLYSVMVCEHLGKPHTKHCGFYYTGLIKPDCDEAVAYLKKQQKRCFDCIKALEGLEQSRELYLHYKSVYDYITQILV